MTGTGDASRRSVSLAASLTIHVALLALLVGRSPLQLTITPAPLVLTFVEAGRVTAGPGEQSPELRSAPARDVAAASLPSEPVQAPPVEDKAPPMPAPAPPLATRPETEPLPKPAVKKPTAAKASVRPVPPNVPAPAAAAPGHSAASLPSASTPGLAGQGATGSDTRSSAPAWAPAARVRYEELLYAWIDRHKQYPMLAQRRGIQGSGSVRVRIDRDGRVLDRALVRSTGESILDQAVLDMVRRASPFPAVPQEYSGSSFEFVAPVEYRLR